MLSLGYIKSYNFVTESMISLKNCKTNGNALSTFCALSVTPTVILCSEFINPLLHVGKITFLFFTTRHQRQIFLHFATIAQFLCVLCMYDCKIPLVTLLLFIFWHWLNQGWAIHFPMGPHETQWKAAPISWTQFFSIFILCLYKPIGAPLQQTQLLLWPLGKINCPPLPLKHTLVYELFDSKCNHKLLKERHVVFSKAWN